jgi:hypothetical protein
MHEAAVLGIKAMNTRSDVLPLSMTGCEKVPGVHRNITVASLSAGAVAAVKDAKKAGVEDAAWRSRCGPS